MMDNIRQFFWFRVGTRIFAGLFLSILAARLRAEVDWQREQGFWAFKTPERHCAPHVNQAFWPAQTIDFFILAKLEANDLSPSQQAAPRELLRRITFDL